MASIHKTKAGFDVRWRFAGKQFNQATGTSSESEARAIAGRIDDSLRAIKSGFLIIPEDADYATVKQFIFSGGRKTRKDGIAEIRPVLTLGGLFKLYEDSNPSKEPGTRYTEQIHMRHFFCILGEGIAIENLDLAAVQQYANTRKRGYERFKPVRPITIEKELKTLGMLVKWAFDMGHIAVKPGWQIGKVDMGREKPPEPFRNYDEIVQIIKARKLTGDDEKSLWGCLFLRKNEVSEVLDYIETHASAPFVLPMFALCALTGCRLSEALRVRWEDVDFKGNGIVLREKKKDSSKEFTTRRVPIHPRLSGVLQAWQTDHPGGELVICDESGGGITKRSGRIDREFKKTLRGGKWAILPGWHCFRHSFASILALNGRDQREINELMGHLDERTAARYRHLFPHAAQEAVLTLLD